MSAPARPSAWPPPWARAQRWWPRSTRSWAPRPRRRDGAAAAPGLEQLLARLRHHREHARTADIWAQTYSLERWARWRCDARRGPYRGCRIVTAARWSASPARYTPADRQRPGAAHDESG